MGTNDEPHHFGWYGKDPPYWPPQPVLSSRTLFVVTAMLPSAD